MEVVRINDRKLKLTLSDSDMKKYGICADTLCREKDICRTALRAMLEDARASTRFDSASRTLIEAFPGRHGGCEIFVILLGSDKNPHTTRTLFYFPEKERLTRAVNALCSMQAQKPESSLFLTPDGGYVLSLSLPAEGDTHGTLSPYSFLCEYGECKRSTLIEAYIQEYGKLLYEENAIEAVKAEIPAQITK